MAFWAALVGLPLLVSGVHVDPSPKSAKNVVGVEVAAKAGDYVRLTRDENYIRRVLTENAYDDADVDKLAGYRGHVTKVIEAPGNGFVGVPGEEKGYTIWLPEELLRFVTKDEAMSWPTFEKEQGVIEVGDRIVVTKDRELMKRVLKEDHLSWDPLLDDYLGQTVKVWNIDKEGRLGVEAYGKGVWQGPAGKQHGIVYLSRAAVEPVPADRARPDRDAWKSPESFAKQTGTGVGDLVRLTRDVVKLKDQFARDEFAFDERMLPMMGRNFPILAINREKHAIALPAPDNSGNMWWFHESLVKPFDAPLAPLDYQEQEFQSGETVRLASNVALMKKQFERDSYRWDDSIRPMAGKMFKVWQVNRKNHAVGLRSPGGPIYWFDYSLVQRQEEPGVPGVGTVAAANLRPGELVHMRKLEAAKAIMSVYNQKWKYDLDDMVGHDFKVLAVSADGSQVALPDKSGHKLWIPSGIVARMKLQVPTAEPGQSKESHAADRGMRPYWEDLKALFLQETRTGKEGCQSKRIIDAASPIWQDFENKMRNGLKVDAKKHTALLEVSDEEEAAESPATAAPAAEWQPRHPSLSGMLAEGLMKCVIDGFPSEIRDKAARYFALGGGQERKEVPRDLRSAAGLRYMFDSMAAHEEKSSAEDVGRLAKGTKRPYATGKGVYEHAEAKLKQAQQEEDQATFMRAVEKAAKLSHRAKHGLKVWNLASKGQDSKSEQ